jgi:hypothetical protein
MAGLPMGCGNRDVDPPSARFPLLTVRSFQEDVAEVIVRHLSVGGEREIRCDEPRSFGELAFAALNLPIDDSCH